MESNASKLKSMHICIALTLAFLLSFSSESRAQNVALKTNLAYDAVAAANLGLEFGLAPRWTMDISGNYMPWNFYNGLTRTHSCSLRQDIGSATVSQDISLESTPTEESSI